MFSRTRTIGLLGMDSFDIDIEVDVSRGLPSFDIIGSAGNIIQECRARIRSVFKSLGIEFPQGKIIISLAPSDIKKNGAILDVAICVGMLKSLNYLDADTSNSIFIGELALNGEIRHVKGVLPTVYAAQKKGITDIFVSLEDAHEASIISGMNVYPVSNISQIIAHLRGEKLVEKQSPYIPKNTPSTFTDFSSVKGQLLAKYAMEVAAAGGHNILLIGPAGTGKTMLARAFPSILPPMTFNESIETTTIYSVKGEISPNEPLIVNRPFRRPHHTISGAGLIGGGAIPQPGEISLAHNGVLFLDEIAEFIPKTLETLRQPLEDRKVTVSRVQGTCTYPSSFILFATMNPCPCGNYGTKQPCKCTTARVQTYQAHVSGPLRDRIDLQIGVERVDFDSLSSKAPVEDSATVRERVIKARELQLERYKGTNFTCNAQLTEDIDKYCILDDNALQMVKLSFEKLNLSPRAYTKLLKTARTVADLAQSEVVRRNHVASAIQLRTLDRNYFME